MLTCLLEKSGGYIPRQVLLQKQFQMWLEKNGMVWTPAERDKCIINLRAMLQIVLDRKRRRLEAPRQFGELEILMNQLKTSRSNIHDAATDPATDGVDESQVATAPDTYADNGVQMATAPATSAYCLKRLRSKQDAIVEVKVPPKKIDLVEISDEDKADDSGDDLHVLLFGNKNKKLKDNDRDPLTAAQLAAMAAGATAGPSPADYAAVTRKAKKMENGATRELSL